MCTGLFSTAASATAIRRICPPPSSWLPASTCCTGELHAPCYTVLARCESFTSVRPPSTSLLLVLLQWSAMNCVEAYHLSRDSLQAGAASSPATAFSKLAGMLWDSVPGCRTQGTRPTAHRCWCSRACALVQSSCTRHAVAGPAINAFLLRAPPQQAARYDTTTFDEGDFEAQCPHGKQQAHRPRHSNLAEGSGSSCLLFELLNRGPENRKSADQGVWQIRSVRLVVCGGVKVTTRCLACLASIHEADAQSCLCERRCAPTCVPGLLQSRLASRLMDRERENFLTCKLETHTGSAVCAVAALSCVRVPCGVYLSACHKRA